MVCVFNSKRVLASAIRLDFKARLINTELQKKISLIIQQMPKGFYMASIYDEQISLLLKVVIQPSMIYSWRLEKPQGKEWSRFERLAQLFTSKLRRTLFWLEGLSYPPGSVVKRSSRAGPPKLNISIHWITAFVHRFSSFLFKFWLIVELFEGSKLSFSKSKSSFSFCNGNIY